MAPLSVCACQSLLTEKQGLEKVEKVCRRSSIEQRVKHLHSEYATHTPSLEWDCTTILGTECAWARDADAVFARVVLSKNKTDHIGQQVFDALAVGEDVKQFCWSYDAKRPCPSSARDACKEQKDAAGITKVNTKSTKTNSERM